MFATWQGQTEVVKWLIGKGADVNRADKNGTTPLMKAAKANNGKAIEVPLAHKADVNLKDKNGSTALDLIGKGKRNKAAALLKQAGARHGVTTAPTEQEIYEKEGLPRISTAVTNIYLVG
jgi:ankyrin repeat protein